MRALLAAALVLALLPGCKSLEAWWDSPIGGQVPQDPGNPAVIDTPGGGTVTIAPPPAEDPTTKGELVEGVAVETVALLGGPVLGALALALLGGIRAKRKQPKPVQASQTSAQ